LRFGDQFFFHIGYHKEQWGISENLFNDSYFLLEAGTGNLQCSEESPVFPPATIVADFIAL